MLEGGAETLVKRLRLSAVSRTSSTEQTYTVCGKECVNSLDCDHHQTIYNIIIQYQRIPLFITHRHSLHLGKKTILLNIFENILIDSKFERKEPH